MLAEAFLTDPKRPAFVIFRPGMDLLPLFAEAIALLPPSRRWEVEFSTYLTQAPRGITYAWRGVLEGTPEAANCNPAAQRAGHRPVRRAGTGRGWAAGPHGPDRRAPRVAGDGRRAAACRSRPRFRRTDRPVRAHRRSNSTRGDRERAGNYELIPELAVRLAPGSGSSCGAAGGSRRRRRTGIWVATLVAACVVPIAATGFIFRNQVVKLLGLNPEVEKRTAESQKVVAEKKQEIEKVEKPKEAPAPVVRTGPKVAVAEPRKQPEAAAEPAKKPSPPQAQEAALPAPEPVAVGKFSTAIKPIFLDLEDPPEEFAADIKPQTFKIGNRVQEIASMELLGGKGLNRVPGKKGAGTLEWVITSRDSSKGSELSPNRKKLATFRASRPGELEFRWAETKPDERASLAPLPDKDEIQG